MDNIPLPSRGYDNGCHDAVRIDLLDVAVGQRDEHSTELFVRGLCYVAGAWTPFAGTTIIREGRDYPDHDIKVFGKVQDGFADALAISVHLALDEFASELMAAEMERICG